MLLPRNFVEYWPRHEQPTPRRPARAIAVSSGRKRLCQHASPLVPDLDAGPDVGFFARVNPGHAEGDMLDCPCPLTLHNWLSVGRKMPERARRLRAR